MRFQEALRLQKQQAEQTDLREEKSKIYDPLKESIHQEYISSRVEFHSCLISVSTLSRMLNLFIIMLQAYHDPIEASFKRLRKLHKPKILEMKHGPKAAGAPWTNDVIDHFDSVSAVFQYKLKKNQCSTLEFLYHLGKQMADTTPQPLKLVQFLAKSSTRYRKVFVKSTLPL